MDACDSVEKEIDKVIQKFTQVKGESSETISEIISVFSVVLSSLGKQRNLQSSTFCLEANASLIV